MTRLRALAAVLLLGGFIPLSSPASAAGGACTSSSGVTVVVNFGTLGGGTVVRCAQTSGNGLDALRAAGFTIEGTQQYGNAFVCRLDGKPAASTESCRTTPPIDKSWRYFYASNGGAWKYSQSGVSSRTVEQGGFEGWSFGEGSTPGLTPSRSGAGSTGAAAGGSGSDATVPDGPSSTEDKSLPKPKPRTGKTAAPSPTPSAAPSTDPVDLEAAETEDGGNAAAPWIAGGLILALIGAVALTRRARS